METMNDNNFMRKNEHLTFKMMKLLSHQYVADQVITNHDQKLIVRRVKDTF